VATARRAFDSAPSAGPLSASQTRAQSDSDRDRISGDATIIEKHEAQRIEAGRHCVPRGPRERDVSAIVGALIDAYAAQKGLSTVGEVIGGLVLGAAGVPAGHIDALRQELGIHHDRMADIQRPRLLVGHVVSHDTTESSVGSCRFLEQQSQRHKLPGHIDQLNSSEARPRRAA
jgi:hypothetical protein